MPGQTFPLEVNPTIPERLVRLNDLAANLRFTWHRPTRALFASLDSELWKRVSGNPRLFLRCVDQGALDQAAVDPTFLGEFQKAISSFDAYMSAPLPPNAAALEQGDLVAYFCAEYGFHESFPIYSGGLGVLAGDHCKAASDLGLSFVAVGLLYRQGYFTQTVDAHGNQVPVYRDFAYEDLPVVPATTPQGGEVRVSVRLPGRDVHARVWVAAVGRVRVVMLDTNLPENSEADREITHKLYGGNEQTRIQQEMILGLGGVKALRAMALAPTVWHMNEGHAAFLTLELMGELVDRGLDFAAALEAVAAQCVFTTHTPVAAGHDVFARDLALSHFEDYLRRLKVGAEDFLRLGRAGGDQDRFNMTQLALTLSRHQNGVSRIHGGISARICAQAWPEVPPEDNPVGYVTNGVHVPTFLFQPWKDQFQLRLGQVWRNRQNDTAFWQKIFEIPDASFWEIRQTIKSSMLRAVAKRLQREHARNRISEAHLKRMTRWLDPSNPNVLTIGFARRFAEYKRAALLFRDPAWLKSIVSDPDRPVVFLFAGKAHPRDDRGQRILREVYAMANSREFLGRVVFVEDYDMGLARSLVAGVDVWLNNPVYPLEASGTSGMKAAINGTINLSVLDGWWAEAYDGENGWAIPSSSDADDQRRDDEDARTLYEILQDHVVPLYYERSDRGLPRGWIAKSKRSMATNIPAFNMHRVLEDYVRGVYRPAAAVGNRLASDSLAPARRLAAWKQQVREVWPGVKLRSTVTCPVRIRFGERLGLKVAAQLNGLQPKDVRVELVLTRQLPDGLHKTPPLRSFTEDGSNRVRGGQQQAVLPFFFTGDADAEGAQIYEIDCLPPWCGQLTCEARIVPHHELLSHPYEMGLMKWI